jgi:hypothetical protein
MRCQETGRISFVIRFTKQRYQFELSGNLKQRSDTRYLYSRTHKIGFVRESITFTEIRTSMEASSPVSSILSFYVT